MIRYDEHGPINPGKTSFVCDEWIDKLQMHVASCKDCKELNDNPPHLPDSTLSIIKINRELEYEISLNNMRNSYAKLYNKYEAAIAMCNCGTFEEIKEE